MTDQTSTLPPSLAIRGSQGTVLVRVGLIFTLYFADGFDPAMRARVRECSRLFLELCGKNLKWIGLEGAEQWDRIGPETLQSWNDFLSSTAGEYDYCIQLRGGQNAQEATDFRFYVMATQRSPPANCSYLTIALPANHPTVTFEAFTKLCLRFCELLSPLGGYGGFGFLESSHGALRNEAEPQIYALAQRFPGIEVNRPAEHEHSVAEGAGVRGASWLTVLPDEWLAALGGFDTLRKALLPAFSFHAYPGGVLVQAGSQPQVGDVNQRLWVSLLPELARLLKPIRFECGNSFDDAAPHRFTKESTNAWLARFENPPPWE